MKQFYKLNPLQIGSGTITPDGFIEYTDDNIPSELQEAMQAEQEANELANKISESKVAKQLALDSITVTTTSGKVFDGRDKDQARMLSAIQASSLLGLTTTMWKLNDNTTVEITLDELKEAHALSIQALGNIIVGAVEDPIVETVVEPIVEEVV